MNRYGDYFQLFSLVGFEMGKFTNFFDLSKDFYVNDGKYRVSTFMCNKSVRV